MANFLSLNVKHGRQSVFGTLRTIKMCLRIENSKNVKSMLVPSYIVDDSKQRHIYYMFIHFQNGSLDYLINHVCRFEPIIMDSYSNTI